MSWIAARLEKLIFGNRPLLIAAFAIATAFMAWSARGLHIDAGFAKLLPLEHEYMQTFTKHREQFGGANRILIALIAKDGDIFTPQYFDALRRATDEVFFVTGIDRPSVRSLFTPNVRFTEVVEDGIAGGNVVPDDFAPTPEGFQRVRENILKANIVGRLVANDFSGTLISAELLDTDPNTGEPLDYIAVSRELEEKIRARAPEEITVAVDAHIIGFAKVIGDITDGAGRVILFFLIAFGITAIFVWTFTRSVKLTVIPLAGSLAAVIWQLGLLTILGYGIDPMGILVPFLIFAIGVSHGVQMVSAVRAEIFVGKSQMEAARSSFRRLLAPGIIALLSDTIGFITILMIKIRVIQEMAVTASLGVAVIILTNLFLIPVLLSYVKLDERYRRHLKERAERLAPIWDRLMKVSQRPTAAAVIGVALILAIFGLWQASDIRIGDLHQGVPELRPDSTYNRDTQIITEKFSIGVDVISVIVETIAEGCIDHEVMTAIDRFAWHMRNVPGVQSVIDLPMVGKVINSGWNEGSLKWRVLPRNQSTLVQAVSYVPTESGLLNSDCSVMPVMIFTSDHKAETIARIVDSVKAFRDSEDHGEVVFRLATGNVGVMAATNEEVEADQFPILIGVFSAVILLCWVTFRSFRAVLCIVLPLALVSLLAYALMTLLQIGLKVSTLPVVALGVGIGVDYGIYIYSRFKSILDEGEPLETAFRTTLAIAGNGVVFTGVTLAIGVATWIFSPLQFQADMGLLLTFMFLVNMLGAIFLLPALATWLLPAKHAKSRR